MAKQTRNTQQTGARSSQASQQSRDQGNDVADRTKIERLEAIAGGSDEDDPRLFLDPDVNREVDKLNATTEEELDALRVNLVQDGGASRTIDTSGRIVDEPAEEELGRLTEAGPMQPGQGLLTVEPGRDDTSRVLRRHHPNSTTARAQDVVEGNLYEPRSEEVTERKVDEGTAA